MADDHGTTRVHLESILERAQGFDIEVIGWLIEEQHVGSATQHLGQMNAVTFAARELTDKLLLVGTLEVERGNIGTSIDLTSAEFDDVLAITNLGVDSSVSIERITALIHITELHGFAYPQ